ncbi:MAG TPA: RecX family transcriptional regulator [Anaerolineales bacterium]|nr:RecX family transcriptional regulator [Anaerolineales bacterium]
MDATITAIKQQKRNPQRVNIYLDENFAFPLAKIVAAWLKVGQRLSVEKVRQLKERDQAEKAFQRALNFLSYRPRSEAEIERNLRKFEVEETVITDVIERLRRGNLLNDADFAHHWVENRAAFRPRGAFALRAELRQKGVPDEVIDQALSHLDETKLARQAARRKATKLSNLEWPDFRNKLGAHLSRRGFDHEIVFDVCEEAWNELKSK